MRRRRRRIYSAGWLPASLACLLGLLVPSGVAAADPRLTVERPADGEVVSRFETPELTISGTVGFDEPLQTQERQRFYLRAEDCVGRRINNEGHHYLSVTPGGTAEPEACGVTGGWAVWGQVAHQLGDPSTRTANLPTEDGMPITFDASRPVTGSVVVSSCGDTPEWELWGCPALGDPSPVGLGAGQVTVQLTLFGQPVGIDAQEQIATETLEYLVTPDRARYTLDYSMTPYPAHDKKDFERLTLQVDMHGAAVGHGWLRYRGKSFIEVPIWTPSSATGLRVAIDDPADLSETGVTVNADGTWIATRDTPYAGDHTIIVQAWQGEVTRQLTSGFRVEA